jgi:hypothetical protein
MLKNKLNKISWINQQLLLFSKLTSNLVNSCEFKGTFLFFYKNNYIKYVDFLKNCKFLFSPIWYKFIYLFLQCC